MLLWWFSDVPDAPEYLVLSEHKSNSVKLKWIPGDDHNSSTTGENESLRVCIKLLTDPVLLLAFGIYITNI